MNAQPLLWCLPLWLACGGGSHPAPAAPEPAQDEDQSDPLTDFDPAELVHFRLVADVETLPVGGKATIGALFEIEEGWHVYWINPGESGLPTKVSVGDTPGLQVSEPRFPGPVRFDSDGEIINYGYRHELLLPMQVTDIEAGGPATVHADASWLACREDACVPGKGSATLHLERDPGPPRPGEEAARFAESAERLPKEFEALAVHGVEAEVLPLGESSRVHLRAPAEFALEVFPVKDEALSDLVRTATGIEFTLHPVEDAEQLLVLSIRRDSVTHYFAVTNRLIASPPQHQGTP